MRIMFLIAALCLGTASSLVTAQTTPAAVTATATIVGIRNADGSFTPVTIPVKNNELLTTQTSFKIEINRSNGERYFLLFGPDPDVSNQTAQAQWQQTSTGESIFNISEGFFFLAGQRPRGRSSRGVGTSASSTFVIRPRSAEHNFYYLKGDKPLAVVSAKGAPKNLVIPSDKAGRYVGIDGALNFNAEKDVPPASTTNDQMEPRKWLKKITDQAKQASLPVPPGW